LKDTHIDFIFANMFKDWALTADTLDFVNQPTRRPIGFWSQTIVRSDEATDFSDYSTDVFGGRICKKIAFITPGIAFRIDRNRWWLPESEITYEHFDSIYAQNDLHSDWFDLGSMEIGLAGDLSVKPLGDMLNLWGEYLHWQYRSGVDAGNHENSDNTGDSTLDISLGGQKGYLATGGIDVRLPLNLEIGISAEIEHYDSMETTDVFINPAHNDGATGRPTLTYEALPQYDKLSLDISLGYSLDNLEASVEFENLNYDKSFQKESYITPQFALQLFDDKLLIRSKAVVALCKSDSLKKEHSTIDFIFNAKYYFVKQFAVEGDVMLKNIKYNVDFADTTPSINIKENYISPYLAVIYEPLQNINLELSYGVRPYNLHGQYTGRMEWIYDTMQNNSISYLDALKRMHLYQSINLVASMRF